MRTRIGWRILRKKEMDEAAIKQDIYQDYLESRTIQDLRRIGNKYSVNLCGKTLVHAPFQIRLKVAIRLLREGLAGRNVSLAKATFLKPDDLKLLV